MNLKISELHERIFETNLGTGEYYKPGIHIKIREVHIDEENESDLEPNINYFKDKILFYLKNEKKLSDKKLNKNNNIFDCQNFIRLLSGDKNYLDNLIDSFKYEYLGTIKKSQEIEEKLQIGDIILLAQKKEKPKGLNKIFNIYSDSPFGEVDISDEYRINKFLHHFAMYLGNGDYISIFDSQGGVILCDIENMYKIYRYNDIFKANLKKPD